MHTQITDSSATGFGYEAVWTYAAPKKNPIKISYNRLVFQDYRCNKTV